MVNKLLAESFWKYVDIKKGNQCWGWKASVNNGGYGQVHRKGIAGKAHRISYELHYGKIPKNAHICHTCNNPICSNPRHLYAGNQLSNTRDMIKAGTMHYFPVYKGEECGNSKLTAKEVKEIKKKLKEGLNCREIAEIYNVGQVNISAINTRKTWKHLIKDKNELFCRKGKGNFKLSKSDVLKIRKMKGMNTEIAAKYGMCPSTIGKIKKHQLWKGI